VSDEQSEHQWKQNIGVNGKERQQHNKQEQTNREKLCHGGSGTSASPDEVSAIQRAMCKYLQAISLAAACRILYATQQVCWDAWQRWIANA